MNEEKKLPQVNFYNISGEIWSNINHLIVRLYAAGFPEAAEHITKLRDSALQQKAEEGRVVAKTAWPW